MKYDDVILQLRERVLLKMETNIHNNLMLTPTPIS